MPHDPRKLLQEILDCAQAIEEDTRGKQFAEYQGNRLLRLATERQFEIIGEAVSRLLKRDAALTARITDYRRIIDFRNAITHGYDMVDDQLIWDAITNKLPTLKREVAAVLAELP